MTYSTAIGLAIRSVISAGELRTVAVTVLEHGHALAARTLSMSHVSVDMTATWREQVLT